MTSRNLLFRDASAAPFEKSAERGLTMLELIIAFVVLQVAIVMFAQFFTAGLDFSRRARRSGMAQILAQAKMEELLRTLPQQPSLTLAADKSGVERFLSGRPGTFEDTYSHTQIVEPFMWVAEAVPSSEDKSLLQLTLYVYTVTSWTRSEQTQGAQEDFYLPEHREHFNLITPLADGSVEITRGKLKLTLSTVTARP